MNLYIFGTKGKEVTLLDSVKSANEVKRIEKAVDVVYQHLAKFDFVFISEFRGIPKAEKNRKFEYCILW